MPQTTRIPHVSVVIPAYNREASIKSAIESVLRQTWQDLEIIIVDDFSADGTVAEAKKVRDPRVRVVSHPRNLGAGAARNTGIREARGTWIAFQDSDDEWLPLKLEKQLAALNAPGTEHAAAYCGMMIVGAIGNDADKRRPALSYVPYRDIDVIEGDILPSLMQRNIVSTQTLVARRDILERIGGFDERFRDLEDWDCAIRLAQVGTFACIDEPLVHQRFSENSITRNRRGRGAAYSQLVDKHHHLMAGYPELLANHYAVIASFQRRSGDHESARKAMTRARALAPLALNLWRTTIRVTVGQLVRRFAS